MKGNLFARQGENFTKLRIEEMHQGCMKDDTFTKVTQQEYSLNIINTKITKTPY